MAKFDTIRSATRAATLNLFASIPISNKTDAKKLPRKRCLRYEPSPTVSHAVYLGCCATTTNGATLIRIATEGVTLIRATMYGKRHRCYAPRMSSGRDSTTLSDYLALCETTGTRWTTLGTRKSSDSPANSTSEHSEHICASAQCTAVWRRSPGDMLREHPPTGD